MRTEAVRSFLAALLHVAWTLAFAFAFEAPPLTLCRHVSRCLAMSSLALVSYCRSQVSLDDILEAQQRLTHVMDALPQFSIKDFSWQAVRLHAMCMAEPSKVLLNEQ